MCRNEQTERPMATNEHTERPMVTIRIPQEIYDAITNLAVRAEDVNHVVRELERSAFDLRCALLRLFHE